MASHGSHDRRAEPGELCTCGRPAVLVYHTDRGDTGHCGVSDGGQRDGPCPFCGADRPGHGPCPDYRLRLDA